jgi:hypothetical protein
LNNRWDLEQIKERIQWYHNKNKSMEAELTKTYKKVQYMFRLKPAK